MGEGGGWEGRQPAGPGEGEADAPNHTTSRERHSEACARHMKSFRNITVEHSSTSRPARGGTHRPANGGTGRARIADSGGTGGRRTVGGSAGARWDGGARGGRVGRRAMGRVGRERDSRRARGRVGRRRGDGRACAWGDGSDSAGARRKGGARGNWSPGACSMCICKLPLVVLVVLVVLSSID